MKKKITLIVLLFVVIAGIVLAGTRFKDYLFGAKYYETPIAAFNAECGFDAVYGDISADREIGLIKLDNENALFFGDVTENVFVAAELSVKDNKYAYGGTVYIYDADYKFNVDGYDQTNTNSGQIKWTVAYNEEDLQKIPVDINVKKYLRINGAEIFVAIYNE